MTDTALPPAPPVTAILESGLYVEDLPAARAFYGGVLGLEEIAHVEGRHAYTTMQKSVLSPTACPCPFTVQTWRPRCIGVPSN